MQRPKLGDEIRALMVDAKPEVKKALQRVLDILSARGRAASLASKNKKRGDSVFYSKIAQKRWGK